jgi:hypothetical protein
MARELQKGQNESKTSFEILAASLFISMVASLVLIVGSAKLATINLIYNYKDPIFPEKYPKLLKKYCVHVMNNFEPVGPPAQARRQIGWNQVVSPGELCLNRKRCEGVCREGIKWYALSWWILSG